MLGIAYLQQDQPRAAEHEFKKVLATRPNDPTAILYLGLAYLHEKELDGAMAVWREYSDKNTPLIEEEVKRQIVVLENIEKQGPETPARSDTADDDLALLRVEAAIGKAIAREKNKKAELESKLGDCGC